jgi:hypothetical protein
MEGKKKDNEEEARKGLRRLKGKKTVKRTEGGRKEAR